MRLSHVTVLLLALMLPETVCAQARASIRSIDFGNFIYPAHAANLENGDVRARSRRSYTLRKGELKPKFDKMGHPLTMWLKFASVDYFDVTGDGTDEAIVSLAWITGGSALPNLVYIYTLRQGRAKLLWAFETGDRADGGLKDIRGENGKLIIELLGKNKMIGSNLYTDDGTKNGDCCPTMFTRTKYVWHGNKFQRIARPEVFPLEK
jgi:hypothetical protein